MADLAGFPYFEFEVDKAGKPVDPAGQGKTVDDVAQQGITDLFIISHGWNNDMAQARDLYRRFFAGVRQVVGSGQVSVADRKFAVLGVLWPSKKFADDELIPGGAASLGGDRLAGLKTQLEALRDAFDNPDAPAILAQAEKLLPDLESKPQARKRFAELLRSLPAATADLQAGEAEDAADKFFSLAGDDLMDRLARPTGVAPARPGAGGAAGMTSPGGGAAGFNPFGGIVSAAQNMLNLTTYYQMKARAGLVGRTAVNDLVRAIVAKVPSIRLHLIGHSFGARLVTSLALGPDGAAPLKFATLTLVQAAFSHNGFADKFKTPGFFRKVLQEHRIAGPILVTHSSKDRAVGMAYPLASMIAGQNADSFGGPDDPFGGLGRNGAQNTTGVSALVLPRDAGYGFQPGAIYNLNADDVILGHSDICKADVCRALLSAVSVTN